MCNTNDSLIVPGSVAQYSFEYSMKGMQKDDMKEYD